jgi:hypothetical protein
MRGLKFGRGLRIEERSIEGRELILTRGQTHVGQARAVCESVEVGWVRAGLSALPAPSPEGASPSQCTLPAKKTRPLTEQERFWIFDQLLQAHEELDGLAAIDDAVVVR